MFFFLTQQLCTAKDMCTLCGINFDPVEGIQRVFVFVLWYVHLLCYTTALCGQRPYNGITFDPVEGIQRCFCGMCISSVLTCSVPE